jgi:tRNA pseudouridine38-40 synthase
MLRLSYDGTHYAGWQIQPNATTVQACVEEGIHKLTGETTRVHGSGRTDQGVHARCQVAHFDLTEKTPPAQLVSGLNGVLPPDIRVTKGAYAPASFHARRSATGKEYRYFIWNGPVVPPFMRHMRTRVKPKLDVPAMRDAASRLVGRHDFSAFTANPNRKVESHVRELRQLRVMKRGKEITIVANGEGFLYKMVRSLTGFLIRVGEGAVDPSQADDILSSRRRTARVPTAPPTGLFLWNVTYESGILPPHER